MAIHDWTCVPGGTWHAFHVSWISQIQEALNDGLLPADYYAQAEQIAGPLGSDVLTLQETSSSPSLETSEATGSSSAAALAPPKMRYCEQADMNEYVLKRRTVVIRHVSGDRVVALLELVSPGNKASRHAMRSFVEKAVESLYRGFHLLVVDLFPPTPRDPNGIHAAIWGEISDEAVPLPPDEPLTLAAYSAGPMKRAFVEPTKVGRELIHMPLFLTADEYVDVPLEATYRAAYRGVARRWRAVLESNDLI